MEIPAGFKIARQVDLSETEIEFFMSVKDAAESAQERLTDLERRVHEADLIFKGSMLRHWWEKGWERAAGGAIMFDEDRKAIIEMVKETSDGASE